ncbi:hypothetical protein P3W24_02610 [Luteibacter sp. PPL201]|jgi:hypothetical protein|uniref:Uncharacterized protein n=1 Tax=Luteibacter sahnii TaxID=3021977 RepID=A0ABT6B709_9GAMM|nr:hypothetical protein [Luteibacter sp. PPL193]MDY1548194.1 hypothetical protein [Luteibacter sp. PPL193]
MNATTITARSALCLGLAFASTASADTVPGHAALDALPDCADVSFHERCRVTLPNGDFAGAPGDNFYHGTFSWGQLVPTTHAMRAHLKPWTYLTDGDDSHLDKPALSAHLVLRAPRDRVFQWLTLTPGRDVDAVFTVHAHVASTGGTAHVAIHAAVPEHGDEGLVSTQTVRTAARGMPRTELVTSLTVPAGSMAGRIGFAIATLEGSAGAVVDDVFVVRTPVGDTLPELVPSR